MLQVYQELLEGSELLISILSIASMVALYVYRNNA